jgi:hypothetical protein
MPVSRKPTEVRGVAQEALSLRELRRALRVTQTEVARRLKKGQEVISRMEQRQDMRLSTLRDYVRSLGGELELVCRFGSRAAVRLRTEPHAVDQTVTTPGRGAPSATEIAMAVTAPFAHRSPPDVKGR